MGAKYIHTTEQFSNRRVSPSRDLNDILRLATRLSPGPTGGCPARSPTEETWCQRWTLFVDSQHGSVTKDDLAAATAMATLKAKEAATL